MRLGSYPCTLKPKTLAKTLYKSSQVSERHRHRYEFNNTYRELFEKKGMVFSGIYEEKNLVEIMELPDHPWFLGCQFHPEFKSRPLAPHPLFSDFIRASLDRLLKKDQMLGARGGATEAYLNGTSKERRRGQQRR